MKRNTWLLYAVAVGGSACSDVWLDPSNLTREPDGRDTLFPTGSDEEQDLAESLAYDHLARNADRLLEGVLDLSTRLVQISDGLAHVRIDQAVEGLPVFGAQAIVHVGADGEVSELTDGWIHGTDVDPAPTLLDWDAIELAVDSSGGWTSVTADPVSTLGVWVLDGTPHLVWRVRVPRLDGTAATSIPMLFVDAHDGTIRFAYDDLKTATCTANTAYNGSISFPCDQTSTGSHRLVSASSGAGTFTIRNAEPWTVSSSALFDITSSSSNWTLEHAAVDAQFGVLETLAYFEDIHGRNGIDGFGGPRLKDGVTTAVVHYGTNYGNAYWDGSAMVFGDGDGFWLGAATALDIAAHELTHGVTEHTADLVYQGESGALNEAVSDVFASLVEHRRNGTGTHVWKIGEDAWTPGTAGDALRYMADPTLDGESKDHYSTRYVGSSDNGGVHSNSGIANLAFKLLADGGRHPRRTSVVLVPALGMDKAGKIWFNALTNWMTPSTNFSGARAATVSAAIGLYGAGSPEVFAVEASWAEVGVGSVPTSTPPPTDPVDPPTDPVDPPMTDGLALTHLSATAGTALTWTIEVPAGATELAIHTSGGTGDADLYVRQGSAPTDTVYDCRPYKSGNEETCTVAAPAAGTWHIRLKAYSTFSGVALTADYTDPVDAPEPPVEADSISEVGLVDVKDGEQRWSLDVPVGATALRVTMAGGTGDADLYVRAGTAPTTLLYDCRPFTAGNNETCTIPNPTPGPFHILVRAYSAYTGVSLTATSE